MISLRIEKVQAIFDLFNIYCLFVGRVFEDELFEIEEGSLMWDFLPYLDYSSPGIGRK